MRSLGWIIAILAVGGLTADASAAELWYGSHATLAGCGAAGCGPAGCGAAGCGVSAAYGAPACCAPSYGLVPGCCEQSPSCCDNVWDGYCQERRHGGRRGWALQYVCRPAVRCFSPRVECGRSEAACGRAGPGVQAVEAAPDVVEQAPAGPPSDAPLPPSRE
ncbi:MAG: hypothetical protein ABIP48_23675 [Planctomycetota bacterium]